MSGRTELPSGLVTFMFTDIEGSTRLARMLAEAYGAVLHAHREVIRAVLHDFGGAELFTEGDSFFVAFGNAAVAVTACVAMQRALAAHGWPGPDVMPRVRIGLHTGRATPVGGEYTSAEVHRAARVAAAAHGGQVLCSEATVRAATAQPPAGAAPHPMEGVDLLDLGLYHLRGFDDPERIFQVAAPGLERSFPRPRTPGAARHNLPAPLTTFVGRRAELAELTALVGKHRLVTVVGGGGAGKSRLALAAAEQLLPGYPDGVWVVDVAAGTDDLPVAVARALGVRAEPDRRLIETIVDRCAHRRLLLLVDTCDAAPAAVRSAVRHLLAGCPGLRVLATGRQPVGVHGELAWRIPPLAPADAFTLLGERAAAARGGQRVPPREDADLVRVASRLEGLPLALELAAQRLQLLSAAQLASRLDDPLTALDAGREDTAGVIGADCRISEAAERHNSLTRTVDWSYRRLGERAARLLERLAVFAGPVELAAVEWCDDEALGALSELTTASLIEVVPGPRYRMPEQVRGYAMRRLVAAGEERAVRERHVGWALHVLDAMAVDADGEPRTVSLTELAPYVGEWQAALRWVVGNGSVRAGLRLAAALDPWWREYGGARDGRDLLFRLYGRLSEEDVTPAELAGVYLVHAGLAEDPDEQTRFLHRAELVAHTADLPVLVLAAMVGRRVNLLRDKRFADAERLCREVIAHAERCHVAGAALPAVLTLAELLWRRGSLDEAAELLGAARQAEAGRPGDRGRRTVDWLLGMVALRRGDLVAAHDHLVVALRSRLRHGFRGAAADAVAAIAVRCALGGDAATAAVLFGGAESVRGERRAEVFGGFWSAQQAGVRATLGDGAFDAAYADGAQLGFDRIVAMALAVEHPDLEQGSARFAPTLH
ncbi:putative ATPase [Krasilnikovia cinnamomea]|uniref:Putative ATPase n=1 Tax=Krasilnikovia cinnamomea TaxID=349313 RepID=A0A4Q7ZJH1_9ACTN|nr:adenylate/guanylate cyclase domain-containing protein [Krasilnikovia cinnamomea]RZU50395.1 putative ATPase [Krasilnikovia cinnamomea]